MTTFFCITGLLVTRWIYSRHLPLSDLYKSLIFLSWSLSIIYMVTYLKKHKNHLSAITAPMPIFTQGFATFGFLTEMHQSEGNLGIYYLNYIRNLFTYLNKSKSRRCKFCNCSILIIWICYLGVNILGMGLHNYGTLTLTSN